MKSLGITALLASLVVMGCGNDAVAPEPRAFSATLVAADGSRHTLAGSAEFVDSSDETGVPTFLIQLFVGSDTNELDDFATDGRPRERPVHLLQYQSGS